MSHVDEGTLHAYLDTLERGDAAGALDAAGRAEVETHLAGCASCAAALAEARALRGRAGTILGAAPSAIEVPPFESMVARTPVRRPARGWVPMAWAASLVLAVGSGWIASGLWREGRIEGPFQASRGDVAADRASLPVEGPPAETLEPAAGEAAPTVGNAAPATTQAAAARQERRVQETEPSVAARRNPEEVQAEMQAGARLQVPPATGAAAAPVRLAEDAQAKARTDTRAERGAAHFVPAAPPVMVPQRLEAAASTLEAMVPGAYPGDTVAAWSGSSPAAAADLLGGPLELLAEARVLSVEIAEPALVRVRQQLPGGLEAELVQWRAGEVRAAGAPAGAAPSPAAADRDEAGELRVLREGRTADGRAWVLIARGDRLLAVRAPEGIAPLALLARLERSEQP